MEALKNTLAVLAGVVGVLTSILTMYAKYLDVKKENAGDVKAADASMAAASLPSEPVSKFTRRDDLGEMIGGFLADPHGSSDVAKAQQLVKAPAIALIVAGVLTFFVNLGMPVALFIGESIAPNNLESRNRQAYFESARVGNPSYAAAMAGPSERISEDQSMMIGAFTVLCLAVPSAVAVLAGFSMLRLKSYWVSIAGSCAIMVGGATFCCIGGIPIGVWSLVILFKPDVSSYFR
jgi:hypothetical protein